MLVVGIAGGTGSGKTTVVRKVMSHFPDDEVALLPQDSYYRDNSHLELAERQKLNFDHPESIEWSLLVKHIEKLRKGHVIQLPIYSYLTCLRSNETVPVKPKHVVIIEGILVLTDPDLRKLMDIKVYVDADSDDRLGRVICRDMEERGRTVDTVLSRYEKTVKPMHLEFIEPSKRYADVIIPQGGENRVGIKVLVSLIKQHLSEEQE